MKIVLTALNATYSHTSLATAYLKSYCQDPRWSIEVLEFTINDHHRSVLSRLALTEADIYGFSCYIWNIDMVLRLCEDLKAVRPDCLIVLGGPEVSFDTIEIMRDCPQIDLVICGEGEQTLRELLNALAENQDWRQVEGMVIRREGELYATAERALLSDLDEIPSPINGMPADGRLIYYETSRGCPFSCAYCLSAAAPGVRQFSLLRVMSDLGALMQRRVPVVKFVDRTFNCQPHRAEQIMDFIRLNNRHTRFHFEINAELLSESFLTFLSQIPPGMFDFEIGIQSTHPATLEAVHRSSNWVKLAEKIGRLQQMGNIHLHVDLIAGLPYENYRRFALSFNQVYRLQADVIQLGFLKMLRGSPLRCEAEKYGYVFQRKAPYEVLGNHVLSFAELDRLHQVEDMVERYYNSHRFRRTLCFLVQRRYQGHAFQLLESLSGFWVKRQYHTRHHRREAEYSILLDYVRNVHPQEQDLVQELLKSDYLEAFPTGRLPDTFQSFNPVDYADQFYRYIKDESFIREYLPDLASLTPRQRRRRLHMEWLCVDIDSLDLIIQPRPTFFLFNKDRTATQAVFQIH